MSMPKTTPKHGIMISMDYIYRIIRSLLEKYGSLTSVTGLSLVVPTKSSRICSRRLSDWKRLSHWILKPASCFRQLRLNKAPQNAIMIEKSPLNGDVLGSKTVWFRAKMTSPQAPGIEIHLKKKFIHSK